MLKKYSFIVALFISLVTFITSFGVSSTNSFIYPSNYTNTSSTFGTRFLFGNSFHDGIDFLAPQGSEIYATLDGVVTFASFTKTGYGNAIILLHDNGLKTLYGHISEDFIVNVGDYISKGDIIAHVGPKILSNGKLNGNTTGPHLHFSIFDRSGKAINPFDFSYEKRE